MRVLGIDYGEKRTGIAMSDVSEIIASPLGSLTETNINNLIEKIHTIIIENNIEKVIIGKPLNMNGTSGSRVQKTIEFADKLKKVTNLEIELIDERLTTVTAANILNESNFNGSKKRKNVIDTLSAVIILQQYLNKEN